MLRTSMIMTRSLANCLKVKKKFSNVIYKLIHTKHKKYLENIHQIVQIVTKMNQTVK